MFFPSRRKVATQAEHRVITGPHGSSCLNELPFPSDWGIHIKPTNIPMMPMAANGRRPILSMYLIKASGHEDTSCSCVLTLRAHSMTVSARRTTKRAINIITFSGNLMKFRLYFSTRTFPQEQSDTYPTNSWFPVSAMKRSPICALSFSRQWPEAGCSLRWLQRSWHSFQSQRRPESSGTRQAKKDRPKIHHNHHNHQDRTSLARRKGATARCGLTLLPRNPCAK